MSTRMCALFMICIFLICSNVFAQDEIKVRVQNKDVPNGGSYFQPLNASNNMIPLYSYDKTTYTIDNKTDAEITINSIVFTPEKDGLADEWKTLDYSNLKNPVTTVKDQKIPPKKNWSFIIQFYPLNGNDRSSKVTITYNGSKKYVFTAMGKGRPKEAKFFDKAKMEWGYTIGGDTTDELTSGLAIDENENLYFSGNVAQVINKFNHDIFIGKVTTEGKLAWLKGWSGKNQDYQRDSGQNAETGGGAGSIDYDAGHLYLAISHSPSTSNSVFYSTVVKVKADTGEIAWQKAWGKKGGVKMAKESSEAYALDVSGDMVYVVGVNKGDAEVLFLGLKKATGEVVFQKSIDIKKGSNDRAYTVKADNKGGAYIGGLTDGKGLLMHLTGVTSPNPKLSWIKKISMGVGSNINEIDVDNEGNAYLSCDRRGASTGFTAMRVNSDGKVAWAKTYSKESGSKNNTHIVRVVGKQVYVGGRLGVPWYDTQFGDGMLVRLNKDNGALEWSTFFYGGKGAEEMAEHRIKGIAVSPKGNLLLAGQVYTNPNNHSHFWGHWYEGQEQLSDYKSYTLTDETKVSTLSDVPAAEYGVVDAGTLESYLGYKDLNTGKPLGEKLGVMTFQTLKDNDGNGPDGDTFVMKLNLK